jgi:hypothetical protein
MDKKMVEKIRKIEFTFIILAITITLCSYLVGTHIAILEEWNGSVMNFNYIYNLELTTNEVDLYQFRLHATNLALWLSLMFWTIYKCHKVCRKVDSNY